ncbi:MAG: TlpA disulfide reductase family protein [Nitriliruptorales bacterium]|nr:TlpA disulfide reductase family protein [Nitriliruptorales bacterium]
MRTRTGHQPKRSALTVIGVVLGAALLFGMAVLAVSYDDGSGAAREASVPTIDGAALPADAVDLPAPVATGASLLTGGEVSVPVDGEPTIIVFLAHWCQHCQREVPVVQDWLDSGGLPAGVAMRAVATGNDPARPNFPPEDWLEREDWTVPTLHDDGSVARAYGLDATPFWAFVAGDGTVLGRTSGMLPVEQLDAVAQQLARSGGAP